MAKVIQKLLAGISIVHLAVPRYVINPLNMDQQNFI